jgi:hypothetical protein
VRRVNIRVRDYLTSTNSEERVVCLLDNICTISQLYLKSKSNTNVIIANRIANSNAINNIIIEHCKEETPYKVYFMMVCC